jgi:primosomal protein N' (replication factor Y)
MRVLVPFRRRKLVGCIDRLSGETDLSRVREVEDLLDPEPLLPQPVLDLCRWVAEYYVAPPGMVLRAALPPGLFAESSYRIGLTDTGERAADRLSGEGSPAGASPGEEGASGPGGGEVGGPDDGTGAEAAAARGARRAVLHRLRRAADTLQATTLREAADVSAIWPVLRSLREDGLVEIEEDLPDPTGPTRTRQVVRLTRSLPTLTAREEVFGRAHRQRELYEYLETMGGAAEVAHLSDRLGFSRSVVRGLEEREVAEIREEEERRDPFSDLPDPEEPRHVPTERQRDTIDGLLERCGRDDPGVALLRGVTGSGKTLVYLEVMKEVVRERGRSALVLVPEISLTPQTVQRFRAVFGDQVALLHSGLSAGERYDEWRALRAGEKRVAVGARSAVFAPVRDLGLLVVDEEHESSYKQSDVPRYHARAVAAMRCRMEGALCLLGSATPSLESWHNARSGRYTLRELPERVTSQPLPEVELVDLRAEREERRNRSIDRAGGDRAGGGAPTGTPAEDRGPLVLSDPLREALRSTLDRGDQAILLLNRRGYSSFVQCDQCGHVWSCRSCNVTLTFHRGRSRIVCHHCGHQEQVPRECDECGASGLSFSGLGTEQVERRVGELFPEARVVRMDVDTTGTRWAHFEILERFRSGEVDVLLGTQMIAKGLDFPGVTLVGVVNADVGLNLPDFRASERTFQLLSQVAGRAGRGERAGRVVVQTSRPEHFALTAAVDHDYLGFAERELEDRRGPGYPPHTRLANVQVTGEDEEEVADAAVELADWTRALSRREGLEGLEVVGPAPCAIDRIRGRWRWHLLLKSDGAPALGAVLRHMDRVHGQPSGELRMEIDRDPESLL